MSRAIFENSVTYAPLIEGFAREISDHVADELDADPVARATSLRQTADLIDPDWLVVSGREQVLAALPDREGESISEYEFEFVSEAQISDLAKVVRIVSEVRSEHIVCTFPDPVTMVTEVFGTGWQERLSGQAFEVLDALHRASQSLTDVLREFQGELSGVIINGTALPEALDAGLSLNEYTLELGALFNLADHYDIGVVVTIPSESHRLYEQLADEFDAVAFEAVEEQTASKLPADADVVGCSFSESLWEADDMEQFCQRLKQYCGSLPSSVRILTQEIPASARPEYVQEFSDFIETKF